jgi:transcriptional regulator with XRE-family HTH domain/quercetin dioxygenase-like cupin family protein
VPPIGERLREERMRRGVSVRGLAREIGVSASLISQIETEKSTPSVSTLYAMTSALGISIEDLFHSRELNSRELNSRELNSRELNSRELNSRELNSREPADGSAVGERSRQPGGQEASARTPPVMTASGPRIGPVVRPGQREVLTLDSGVTWELLGRMPHSHVDFLLITYQPGGTSSSSGLLMRHSGTEYGYMISGALVLTLGFDKHRLVAGDAVSFDSTTPHGYHNDGTEPAVGVWFVQERSG